MQTRMEAPARQVTAPVGESPKRLIPRIADSLARLGALPSDSAEERTRKAALILVILLILPLATIWVVTYAILGRWWAAAIPLAYQVLSMIGLLAFLRTKRYEVLRAGQLVLMLLLPFALQWTLGGFRNSSAVAVWAFVSPLGALVLVGPRRAWPWLVGWALLLGASALIESTFSVRPLPEGLVIFFFFANITGVSMVTFLLLRYFVLARDREHSLLQAERAKSERLLLNVLPEPIAARLKEREEIIADAFPDVSVLFADIEGFTPYTQRTDPEQTVQMLNVLFSDFDAMAEARGLEKIKTIGDAYMLAGGLPELRPDHAEAVAGMALDMLQLTSHRSFANGEPVRLRIGIDCGPVVAGVIGRRKFIYDLWGDTVNTASRMESHGLPGSIQVTERVRDRLAYRFEFQERGVIQVKGKGEMTTYLLLGRK